MMQSIRAHDGGSSSSSASTGSFPWIFLSHSGYQKDFTRRLNEELVHAHHRPFFDQDAAISLSKGIRFPERILESCQGCKMGIIVLSNEYMESFWPMLELQQLCKNSQVLLYPLFDEVQPADLTSPENLKRWQCKWNEWQRKSLDLQEIISSSGSKLQINTDIASWPAALEQLKFRSGDVRSTYDSDDAYLKAIVSHVCSALPPPQNYILSVDIKGGHRMQQEINKLFNEEVSGADDGMITMLGVHGIGGSGKSTLCLNMANYYSKEFLGRSCCLELPYTAHAENDTQQLLQNIKAVLPTFAQSSDGIFMLEQAMTCLQEGLSRNKVFLALDNVWDKWVGVGWDTAKKIMLMNCMPGSKIMVTSRSKGVLETLFCCRNTSESEQQQYIINSKIVHIPSITEDEAIQALMSYSCFSHLIPPEDLRSLARSCFFGEQCHPLYLKTIGAGLRATGKALLSDQEWKKHLLDLQAQNEQGLNNIEDAVMVVIKKSFERLSTQLQSIFEDFITCMPKMYYYLDEQCEWLSAVHDGLTTEKIRNQLLELEYHGLLEVIRSGQGWDPSRKAGVNVIVREIVRIHDLHKLFVARKTLSPDAPANHFLYLNDLCSVSKEEFSKYKYIWGVGTDRKIGGQSNLEVLVLNSNLIYPKAPTLLRHQRWLSLKSMKALRFLELKQSWMNEKASKLTRCSGWEGAPNLVSLKLDCFVHLEDIGHLGSLLKLEVLVLNYCNSLKVVNVGKLQKLRILDLSSNKNLVDIYFIKLGGFSKLQKLRKFLNNSFHSSTSTVNSCEESAEWSPPNLQKLDVSYCERLKSFPNLRDSAVLTTLRAVGCSSLTKGKISALALTSLQVLEVTTGDDFIAFRSCSHDDDDDDDDARRSFTVLELLASTLCDQHIQPEDSACSSVEANYGLVNLEELELDLRHCLYPFSSSLNTKKIILLDVGGLASLKSLLLKCFPSLQEIARVSSLVTLRSLELSHCESLKEMNGLGALTNLEDLTISECSTLRQLQIAGLDALTSNTNYKLKNLRIRECSLLQQIIGLGALTNLQNLFIKGCSSLQQVTSSGALTNLKRLSVVGCSSLQQINIGLSKHQLTSLPHCAIRDCPKLADLSESIRV